MPHGRTDKVTGSQRSEIRLGIHGVGAKLLMPTCSAVMSSLLISGGDYDPLIRRS